MSTGREEAAPIALVTGATGAIGPVLVRRLLANGCHVRALVRSLPAPGLLPSEVQVVPGDLTDSEAVRAAVGGATAVYHLAARLHVNNPGSELAAEYRRINVEGTRLLAAEARRSGVRRLIYFSTISVYGCSVPGELLDEESPAAATSLYGETKRDAEEIVLSTTRLDDGEPLGVVLRIAGVYGARIKGNYRQLVRWLRRGMFVPVGRGLNRRTLVHEQDVAEAALLAAVHPAAAGRIFNVTDGEVHAFRDIVQVICHALGRRPPRLHMPVPFARTGARIVDAGLRVGQRPSVAGPLLEKLLEDMAVSGRRIHDELGFVPLFDLQRGWEDTIPKLIVE